MPPVLMIDIKMYRPFFEGEAEGKLNYENVQFFSWGGGGELNYEEKRFNLDSCNTFIFYLDRILTRMCTRLVYKFYT